MEDAKMKRTEPTLSGKDWRNVAAFWLLGCINNATYVIMNAGATEIAAGGVALVYMCGVGPSLLMKVTLPYWVHLVGYRTRVVFAACCMMLSLALVAFGSSLGVQLLGVCFSAVQSGLGEASMLGLAAKYNPHTSAMLTAWSSGTGFAGIFGYAWLVLLHDKFDLTFAATLMLANLLVVSWLLTYFVLLTLPPTPPDDRKALLNDAAISREKSDRVDIEMSARERFFFVAGLWRFTVPLFVVFFSEYAMQSGAWAVIGFPLDDAAARAEFYTYANWTYQAGVFISRSSGMYFKANVKVLWVMPLLQAAFLSFFVADAIWLFWWDWTLLLPCFLTGLLGGAVYVNAFTLINQCFAPGPMCELALSAASLGDGFGILMSDVSGLFIQACLFKVHGIPGARVSC